ncbi:hypothetical protein VI06_11585 [Aquitalea magnusonii]|nr:hypothetical protein VI06_11585 [Aquitalea magnusonii]
MSNEQWLLVAAMAFVWWKFGTQQQTAAAAPAVGQGGSAGGIASSGAGQPAASGPALAGWQNINFKP